MTMRNRKLAFFLAVCGVLAGVSVHGNANERLRIEVLPVYVLSGVPGMDGTMSSTTTATCIPVSACSSGTSTISSDGAAATTELERAILSTHEVMATVHRAMGLLGVLPSEFELVLHEREYEALACSVAEPGSGDVLCRPGRDMMGFATGSDVNASSRIHEALGYENETAGTVLLLPLVKPNEFPWPGTTVTGGSAEVRAYTVPMVTLDYRWQNTACTAWAHATLAILAHELGHCFGLDHNGPGDTNFDGVDNSYDLMMAALNFLYSPLRLKPSNRARVRVHFGDSESEPVTTGAVHVIMSVD